MSIKLNPFTAPACKIPAERCMHAPKNSIFRSHNRSTFSAIRFAENPFKCQCERENKKANFALLMVVFERHHGSEGVKIKKERKKKKKERMKERQGVEGGGGGLFGSLLLWRLLKLFSALINFLCLWVDMRFCFCFVFCFLNFHLGRTFLSQNLIIHLFIKFSHFLS